MDIFVSPKAKTSMWCDTYKSINVGISNNIERKFNAPVIANNV